MQQKLAAPQIASAEPLVVVVVVLVSVVAAAVVVVVAVCWRAPNFQFRSDITKTGHAANVLQRQSNSSNQLTTTKYGLDETT